MTGAHRSAAGDGCVTCADLFRIAGSPVVDGLCPWGHVDPRALFAPLTKMETAALLEAVGAGAELCDSEIRAIVAGRSQRYPADRTQIAELGAELGELRADLRVAFERKFFATGNGTEEGVPLWQ